MSKKLSNCRSKWQQEKFVNYRVAKKRQKNLVKLSRLAAKTGKQNCIFTKNTEFFWNRKGNSNYLWKLTFCLHFDTAVSRARLRKICTWHLNKLRFVMINWNRSKGDNGQETNLQNSSYSSKKCLQGLPFRLDTYQQ